MRLVPAHLRGRVFALLRTSMQLAPLLGGVAAAAPPAGPGLRLAVLATTLVIHLPAPPACSALPRRADRSRPSQQRGHGPASLRAIVGIGVLAQPVAVRPRRDRGGDLRRAVLGGVVAGLAAGDDLQLGDVGRTPSGQFVADEQRR